MGDWKQVSTAADRIQQAMNEAGKKQADLVEATGLNKSTISRYLSGQVEPKQKAIMTLAQALDVSEMWLWGYDVPKERIEVVSAEIEEKNDLASRLVYRMFNDRTFLTAINRVVHMDDEQLSAFLKFYASLKKE